MLPVFFYYLWLGGGLWWILGRVYGLVQHIRSRSRLKSRCSDITNLCVALSSASSERPFCHFYQFGSHHLSKIRST